MKLRGRYIALNGLLAIAAALGAAGCNSSNNAVDTLETGPSPEDISKIRFAIERLEDPKLFDSGFQYLCDIGKPAVPYVIEAVEARDHGLRTGANMTLEGITGHKVGRDADPKVLAKKWRKWWMKNKDIDMPIIEKRPAAEVVPPGPRGGAAGRSPIDAGLPVTAEGLPIPPKRTPPDFSRLRPASDDEKDAARKRMLELLRDKAKPEESPEEKKKPEDNPEG